MGNSNLIKKLETFHRFGIIANNPTWRRDLAWNPWTIKTRFPCLNFAFCRNVSFSLEFLLDEFRWKPGRNGRSSCWNYLVEAARSRILDGHCRVGSPDSCPMSDDTRRSIGRLVNSITTPFRKLRCQFLPALAINKTNFP